MFLYAIICSIDDRYRASLSLWEVQATLVALVPNPRRSHAVNWCAPCCTIAKRPTAKSIAAQASCNRICQPQCASAGGNVAAARPGRMLSPDSSPSQQRKSCTALTCVQSPPTPNGGIRLSIWGPIVLVVLILLLSNIHGEACMFASTLSVNLSNFQPGQLPQF